MIKRKAVDLRLLNWIYQETMVPGVAPSLERIGQEVGLSSKLSLTERLEKLEAAGLINQMKRVPRTIGLTATGRELVTEAKFYQ